MSKRLLCRSKFNRKIKNCNFSRKWRRCKDKIFESLETMDIGVNEKYKEDIFIDEIEWELIDNINEAYIDDFYITEESK